MEHISQASPATPGRNSTLAQRAALQAPAQAQPYAYPRERPFEEPDWRRLTGCADVTEQEWRSARWQRQHTVKSLAELQRVLGDHLSADLAASIERDQAERATMSMLVPPQMLNTMNERELWSD